MSEERNIVHRITMTDDRTLRLYTYLATLDYYEDEWYKMERQLEDHKYENVLVLEPNYDFHAPVIVALLFYFMKKGYAIDIDSITEDMNNPIILKRAV